MASSTKTVIALHGFLGQPSDWSVYEDLLPSGWALEAIDLAATPILPFENWAERFASSLKGEGPKVLLGYSMGGRLALHALAKTPDRFSGAMIVSANPGLSSHEEREARRKADAVWATKFLEMPWPELMNDWNGQAALRPPENRAPDFVTLDRRESDFDRQTFAHMMKTWSLGEQRDLRADIDRLSMPIEYVTGESDAKFTGIASDWMKHEARGRRTHVVIENAGHRVPWDAPAQFRAILANFLSRW